MSNEHPQSGVVDREHLKILEIFYYMAGGSKVLFALFPLIYVIMGIVMIVASSHMPANSNDAPPAFLGWLMVGVGLMVSAIIAGLGAAQMYVGRCIHKRQHRVACFVIAAFGCLNMPWGIALGVVIHAGETEQDLSLSARET